ncbi:unnamed protein product [Arabidopsis thaliana]|uniref:Bifunctional inhibitor/plant lipid transfer protein/seed storage helical domain-containing protein n=1 Tax=Arabidopsis thaliana TaxID=3702 RepID=A0A654F1T5_ARATH|nr:unnamed protein product [Arabidopsis thaliana]
MESRKIKVMATAIALIMVAMVVDAAGADKGKDKEECTAQLVGMATCLPYVQGQAKSPTPDCCSGLKQVINSDMKCLCVIIQERNDPDLGLQVNVSLALALPSVCHATADITKCPALLHLDPNSPDAQVFYQLAKGLNETVSASAPTGSASEPTSMSSTPGSSAGNNSGRTTSVPGTNHAQSFSKQWLGLEVVAHFFVIFYIFILV